MGSEYSFASGSGIFEGPPKVAPGAKFRVQIEMGAYDGGRPELNRALDDLRNEFGPDDYNLVRRNCNNFCNALVWKLLRIKTPPYVNRWADIGVCCSCLLPKKLLEEAPVGHSGTGSSSPFAVPTSATMQRSTNTALMFTGEGHSLGSSNTSNTDTSGSSEGFLSKWNKPAHKAEPQDDLTDRRERARRAALARLEGNQQQPSNEEKTK
jgi:hypothetical protein